MSGILDDPRDVRGIIYCIEHIESGKKYVGQTRSHRLNHGRYRPFGADGRFRDHISCATRNTKPSQSSALHNAIREFGAVAFRFSQLEECEVAMLDIREAYWITEIGSLYPAGYNLSTGGMSGHSFVAHIGITTPLNPVGPRGGCGSRSEETRKKMSISNTEALASPAARAARAEKAAEQHSKKRAEIFAGVTIDASNISQYIRMKGEKAIVCIEGRETSFVGKHYSKEECERKAREFLTELANKQTATLPNCSGNP